MTNFVSCIFCHEHCDNLAALKDHSATCPEHPAVKKLERMTDYRRESNTERSLHIAGGPSVYIDLTSDTIAYANLSFVMSNGVASVHELGESALREIAVLLRDFADEMAANPNLTEV